MKQLLFCSGLLGRYGMCNSNNLRKLTHESEFLNIIKISAGGYHVLILSDKNKLYGCGCNEEGQLGFDPNNIKHIDNITEIPVILPSSLYIIDICASGRSSYLVLNNGSILSFGWNVHYQLGRETFKEYDYVPEIIPYLDGYVCSINGNFWWAMHLLTKCQKVISFGCNEEGKMGLDARDSNIKTPTINHFFDDKNVIKICEGAHHTAFLTNIGTVYIAGHNYHGQLALSKNIQESRIPILVESLTNEFITDVFCLSNSVICKTTNHNVYVWGNNSCNKIGLYDSSISYNEPVLLIQNVLKIKGGSNHTCFIDKNKIIYTCGLNDHGQLYHANNEEKFLQPIKKINYNINDIICGAYFTIFISGQYGYNHYFEIYKDDEVREIRCNQNAIKKVYTRDTIILTN